MKYPQGVAFQMGLIFVYVSLDTCRILSWTHTANTSKVIANQTVLSYMGVYSVLFGLVLSFCFEGFSGVRKCFDIRAIIKMSPASKIGLRWI
jgi:succinate dehydrogenase/fumarate reductase cytochrome b subunit